MATLGPESPPSSPSFNRRRKSWARRCERACCNAISYFPLAFVYGLTTWAVWVELGIGFSKDERTSAGVATSVLGLVLYVLANVSYTTAVFTDPGSPLNPPASSSKSAGYSSLPTHEPHQPPGQQYSSLTAKSDGKPRYCKKCQSYKPDRTHHCGTCNRCVLKMDHHCPWLATCVGFRNYKPFILFLIYTSLFCWACFAVSARWVWDEILDEAHMQEGARVVNIILLAVLGGIIGLVLSGFTGWHIYLVSTGQTTIESLEKTRYLTRNTGQQAQRGRHYLGDGNVEGTGTSLTDQLKELPAATNAIHVPGVTDPEEGISNTPTPFPYAEHHSSSASESLRRNYASMEEERERDRYASYLDEQDSSKLPHAFNLGWRRNLTHVFGENKLLWPLPICNTTGDGWNWEVSQEWLDKREEIAHQRRMQEEQAGNWHGANGWDHPGSSRSHYSRSAGAGRHFGGPAPQHPAYAAPRWSGEHDAVDGQYLTTSSGIAHVPSSGRRSPAKADQILGRVSAPPPRRNLPMALRAQERRGEETPDYDTSSDEDKAERERRQKRGARTRAPENWNDVPDEFLGAGTRAGARSRSTGRRKGD